MSLADQSVHFLIFVCELLAVEFVRSFVIRADELVACSEDIRHGPLIVISNRHEKRVARFLGRLERRLV